MKALLLIDLQNDFMPGGALAVPDGLKSVEAANKAQNYFSLIVATKDWHPSNHKSFAKNHPGKKPGDQISLGEVSQILWPEHCVQNSHGSQLVSTLNQKRITHIITKGEDPSVDSYSGFFDNAHLRETGLHAYLKGQGVTQVFVLGVATDYCVAYTALDALDLGYETFVIVDGCAGIDINEGDIQKSLSNLKEKGAVLITLKDLEKKFAGKDLR